MTSPSHQCRRLGLRPWEPESIAGEHRRRASPERSLESITALISARCLPVPSLADGKGGCCLLSPPPSRRRDTEATPCHAGGHRVPQQGWAMHFKPGSHPTALRAGTEPSPCPSACPCPSSSAGHPPNSPNLPIPRASAGRGRGFRTQALSSAHRPRPCRQPR